jgi:predicted PurR-regulated permease PerM
MALQLSKLKAGAETTPAVTEVEPETPWTSLAVIGIFLIMSGAVLVLARELFIPVVSAMVIGSMIGPLAEKLQARGIPTPVTAILLVLVLLAALYGLFLALAGPVTNWISRGPELQSLLQDRLQIIQRPVARIKELFDALGSVGDSRRPLTVDVASNDLFSTAAGVLTPAIGELIVFFGTVVFYVADRRRIKHRVAGVFRSREDRLKSLKIFTELETELRGYLYVVTLINIGLGLATAALTFAIGLPSFYLWGILAFVLNYAPYVGPAIMALILALVSVITFESLGYALLAPGAFILIATIEGHFMTPGIVGRHLTLRPFIVFLSIAFWTWLWGPIGTLLATPILIICLVIMRYVTPKDEIPLPG